ncbi:DUF4214 domain-containing protein [Oxalobacteraceae bacterium OM1]|nr:DUF4214 domain-containing protein [Oxalobacteraceae bacterium OM1]
MHRSRPMPCLPSSTIQPKHFTGSSMNDSISFLPISANIISNDTGQLGRFVLTNKTTDTLSLYWIDRAGVLQKYAELAPAQTWQQSTSTSHAWLVKNAAGSIGFEFYPTVYGEITVASPTPSFTAFSERTIHTPIGDWDTYKGYGLIDMAASLGVPDIGYTLPIGGQNNNLALNLVHAPSAWKAGYTGAGVTIAEIDVGVAPSDEINQSVIGGYDFEGNDTDATPAIGAYRDHGLGATSIMVGRHDFHSGPDVSGVAPDAKILSVRDGGPNGGNDDNMAKSILWAVDHGAKVLCIPQGSDRPTYGQQVHDAIQYAFDHNVVTVFAGGNSSIYGASGPALAAKEGICIAVGNYDVTAGAPFGSTNLPGDTPFPWVMAASTGYVAAPDGTYKYWLDGGTSYASPYVAGLAALLWQKYPNATAKFIIDKIIAGAASSPTAVTGTAQDDLFANTAANDAFDGGAGLDTVTYQAAHGAFALRRDGAGITVTDSGTGAVDTLVNVERLRFSDMAVAFDTDGAAGQAYRLYAAAFNRTPDLNGLGFWLSAMDHGKSLNDVATAFAGSDEFKSLYGANPAYASIVAALYHNVLHRDPSQTESSFWVGQLQDKGMAVSALVVNFSESAENKAQLIGTIQNGIEYTYYA